MNHFPGISTTQTRAKYFLTLPRIFRDYQQLAPNERRRISLADYLKEQEGVAFRGKVGLALGLVWPVDHQWSEASEAGRDLVCKK